MPRTIYQCSIPRQSEAECTWLNYSDGFQRCHGTGKQVELCACRSERLRPKAKVEGAKT